MITFDVIFRVSSDGYVLVRCSTTIRCQNSYQLFPSIGCTTYKSNAKRKQWQHFISSINLWCGKLAISKWIFAQEKGYVWHREAQIPSTFSEWKINSPTETYENHLKTDQNGKLLKNLHLRLALRKNVIRTSDGKEKGKRQVYFSHPISKK